MNINKKYIFIELSAITITIVVFCNLIIYNILDNKIDNEIRKLNDEITILKSGYEKCNFYIDKEKICNKYEKIFNE